MPVLARPLDQESAADELRALGLALAEPVQAIYGRALAAEVVGLAECLAAVDLLTISGLGDEAPTALHALLLGLFSARGRGSLCLSLDAGELARALGPLVGDAAATVQSILRSLASGEWGALVATGPAPFRPVVRSENGRFLYLRRYYLCEGRLRERLARLGHAGERPLEPSAEEARRLVLEANAFRGFRLNAAQMWGVYLAVRKGFVVVTGGPGTGKTTLVTSLLRVLDRCGVRTDRIALIAPTGRAAQRLTESLAAGLDRAEEPEERLCRLAELEGTTIHRLLRFQPQRGAFAHDEDYPLPLDAVVVDEVSMVDVALMEKLLAAVRPGALVVFLGDKDQLPSVEAGAVLADLIPVGGARGFAAATVAELQALTPDVPVPACPRPGPLTDRVVALAESNRMAGPVYQIAQRINCGEDAVVGELPRLSAAEPIPWPTDSAACVLLDGQAGSPTALHRVLESWIRRHWTEPPDRPPLAELLRLAGEALSRASGGGDEALVPVLDRLSRASILTILRRGSFGVDGVNRCLAERFRHGLDAEAGSGLLFSGAPVLVTRNTPGLGLFNGDLGLAVRDPSGRLVVLFRRGGAVLRIPAPLLPPHELAFALTVHKSQGSEYDNVFLVVPPASGHRLLTREIVYTGITRARRMVAVWSRPGVLAEAVRSRVERRSAMGLWPDTDPQHDPKEVLS